MKRLQNVRITWLGTASPDVDALMLWLRSEGAELHVTEAFDATFKSSPSVLVIDFRTNSAEAEHALATVRADAARRALPVVGLVAPNSALPGESETARCNKYLAPPIHPVDLVSAIVSLAPATPEPNNVDTRTREEVYREIVQSHATRNDLRALLGFVNTTGPFRFTSIIRFEDDEKLSSVWTFDRQNPDVDSFPLDLPTTSSYCSYVRDSVAPFSMPDAAKEPRADNHPARHSVLAYCGVPLLREDGSFFGTLCQFDTVPRFFQEVTVRRLSDAATVLAQHLPELSRSRGDARISIAQEPSKA